MGINLKAFSIGAVAGLLLAPAAYAQGSSYDKLVSQAQADLSGGDAAKALTDSQKAIKAAPARWEAYVVAGGALQMEHQYDKAVAEFSLAVENAPDAKKSAVRALLQKAVAGQTSAQQPPQSTMQASNSTGGPSYADTVAWITANITRAGLPQNNETSTSSIGLVEHKEEKYSFQISSCNTFTISYSFEVHDDQLVTDRGVFQPSTAEISAAYNFDMNHVGFATQSGNLQDNLYVIALDGTGHYHFYNGAEDLAGDLTYSAGDTNKLANVGLSPWGTASGGVAVSKIIPFKMPGGAQDLPSRMVTAFQHLQQICEDHPEQAPKQPF